MDETEFKKLTSNSRDWLIYQLLNDKSKESWSTAEHMKEDLTNAIKIIDLPIVETSVQEIIQGIIGIVTDKAVQIAVGNRFVWLPKSSVKNLNLIVLEQGKPVEVILHAWFIPKVEWKVFD